MFLTHKSGLPDIFLFQTSLRKVYKAYPEMRESQNTRLILPYIPRMDSVLGFQEGYYPHIVHG